MSERYVRQATVVGARGQEALARARVLIVGAGGLGSPAAMYLAGAGVGTIGIVDDDVVELSNLHRQPVHMTDSVGRPKVESAAAHLRALNPEVRVEQHRCRLSAENARDIVARYDLVVDGADNFATRYVVSDACRELGLVHVWAAVLTTGGQLSVFPPGGPTYRDLYPHPPQGVPTCAEAGVLGVVPGLLGVAQAAEAIKLIVGLGTPLIGQVGVYDMLTGTWEYVPLVGTGRKPEVVEEVEEPVAEPMPAQVEPEQVGSGAFVLDVREPHEFEAGHAPGARLLPLSTIMENPVGSAAALAQAVQEFGSAEVFVVCHAGVRSQYAIDVFSSLDDQGLADVNLVNVTGGMSAWEAAGKPVVQD